jgi:vacuolar protein sorting-associated protein 13A/C
LRLVGSSDLIGNPTDFVNTLGTGVKSFYYEPRDGFMKGPLQGGLGLVRGTGSLAAHVVGGIAGSVGKVTNTLNKGLLQLSGDTEYIHKKEIKDIRQKPTGAIDGLGKGLKGLGTSIWGGVTGIVMKPVQGAKRDGVGGFAKGVGLGLAGALVKPASGVVDLVAKTNEGIESAVDGNACKPNNQKFRRPRAFYKETEIFKEYNEVEAVCYLKLHKTNSKRYQGFASTKDSFYGAFKVGENVGPDENIDSPILMLTKNSVVLFNQTFEVIWYRHQIDLIRVELEQAKLLVSWQKPPQGKFIGEDQDLPKQIRFASEERS